MDVVVKAMFLFHSSIKILFISALTVPDGLKEKTATITFDLHFTSPGFHILLWDVQRYLHTGVE